MSWQLSIDKQLTKIYARLDCGYTYLKLSGLSAVTQTNLKKYAHAILVDPSLYGYREKLASKCLLMVYQVLMQEIVKKEHFDLPAGIEKNRAHWEEVEKEVSTHLTQRRRAIKDEIKKAGPDSGVDIYTLARRVVGRDVYWTDGKTEGKFWMEVDKVLDAIRTNAKGDKIAASNGLKLFIDDDISKYGRGDGEEPDANVTVPNWVKSVNDVVRDVGRAPSKD
ncbi:hypothetical protein GLOTRDRAFT_95208 [Gloeophyllum trabeum ATCC 11539]|uniref:Uncharacterized protein n=1 Tax=Gloeophyllum trabeum (strain ATCC 11539 / FP-39264 / Madison 617) TaxID=670483 RepID=S7Q0G8_GLOTA|nr:uncharacterized protein GLOTRDRAFT_95208 [Gloeophyllum trabeum ATCC 11539]EPQ53203.1 hypothetical protein GLOTRDRAFT_95208 [Gloeophyllum trabeum ATCC 11539]